MKMQVHIMEQLSLNASEMEEGNELVATKELVQERLAGITKTADLSHYIL